MRVEEFKRLMVQPANANEWFAPPSSGGILAAGQRLGPGECFGYELASVSGGAVEPDDFEPTDLPVHFSTPR